MKRIKQEQHIEIEEKSQQLKFRMQTEIQINKHHALFQASDQLEELDYTKLYFAYSGIRKSQIEPRVLFKVLVCAYMNYAKTREVYAAYRKAGYSKKFLDAHREEITLHKAAKAAFDDAGLQKLPKVKELDAEFAELLTKKKAAYPDYRKARNEMQELVRAQKNVERFFAEEKPAQENEQAR